MHDFFGIDSGLGSLPKMSGTFTLLHGTRASAEVDRIGFRLQKPWATENGWGLYLTDSRDVAEKYGTVYRVAVRLNRALKLSSRDGSSERWREVMRKLTGFDPMHGNWNLVLREMDDEDFEYRGTKQQKEDKVTANVLWREVMLKHGFDGVSLYGWGGPHIEVVVYEPEKSVIGYRRDE